MVRWMSVDFAFETEAEPLVFADAASKFGVVLAVIGVSLSLSAGPHGRVAILIGARILFGLSIVARAIMARE